MLVEGVHFDRTIMTPGQIGRKAMGVNLSDIAAMAGEPVAALVAIALPRGSEPTLGDKLIGGMRKIGDEYGTAIIGGDTNRSTAGLVISVTLLGHPTGRGPLLRSGAQAGDAVCVTGSLGYSLLRHHWDFTPRIREAQRLHADYEIHSMMDLSDGLASDIFHLAHESGCGFKIRADLVPVAEGLITDDRSPLDHALNDGEDFELLFTLSKTEAARLVQRQPLDVPVTIIGEVTTGNTVMLVDADGKETVLQPGGYVHEW
jgi:thiamine-monophosphate kinase